MENSSDQEKKIAEDKKGLRYDIILLVVVLLLLLMLVVNASAKRGLRAQLEDSQKISEMLRQKNTELTEKVAELEERDGEQDKELAAMSKSLTTKTDELTALQEKDAARYIPNIYPLRGAAALLNEDEEIPDDEEPEEEEEEEEAAEEQMRLAIPPNAPSAVFMTSAESRAIATAEGTVTKVTGDADKGYQIVLDHGNGYITVYEGFGLALVGENDTVGKGSVLLYFVDDTSIFTYWVQYDDTWLDPLDNIDING